MIVTNLHPLGALVWKRCKIHDLELEGIELALRKRKSGRRQDWGSLESGRLTEGRLTP